MFTSEVLSAQEEAATIKVVEGDNEIAIIDAGSNGIASFALVVVSLASDDHPVILEEFFSDLLSAIDALHQFLRDEYAGA